MVPKDGLVGARTAGELGRENVILRPEGRAPTYVFPKDGLVGAHTVGEWSSIKQQLHGHQDRDRHEHRSDQFSAMFDGKM